MVPRPLVRAAWRASYRAKTEGVPIPDEVRRILNDYRRPGAREYQRKKLDAGRKVPPRLYHALRDRGVSAHLINRYRKQLKPRSRYLIVGSTYRNQRKELVVRQTDEPAEMINLLSKSKFGAVVIDTQEIQ